VFWDQDIDRVSSEANGLQQSSRSSTAALGQTVYIYVCIPATHLELLLNASVVGRVVQLYKEEQRLPFSLGLEPSLDSLGLVGLRVGAKVNSSLVSMQSRASITCFGEPNSVSVSKVCSLRDLDFIRLGQENSKFLVDQTRNSDLRGPYLHLTLCGQSLNPSP
jgi:hypothetical protein